MVVQVHFAAAVLKQWHAECRSVACKPPQTDTQRAVKTHRCCPPPQTHCSWHKTSISFIIAGTHFSPNPPSLKSEDGLTAQSHGIRVLSQWKATMEDPLNPCLFWWSSGKSITAVIKSVATQHLCIANATFGIKQKKEKGMKWTQWSNTDPKWRKWPHCTSWVWAGRVEQLCGLSTWNHDLLYSTQWGNSKSTRVIAIYSRQPSWTRTPLSECNRPSGNRVLQVTFLFLLHF